MKSSKNIGLACLASLTMAFASGAQAQQFKSYSFDPQNRGQLAVAMKQIEESGAGGGVLSGAAGSAGTTIVCGGGASTAQANNTCIILNNSTGTVATDQISDGGQTASNSEQTSLDGNQISGADEVLSTLTQ